MTSSIEYKINHAVDSVEPSAEFTQALWNQIRMTPRKENSPKRISRFVWIPALTVLGILVVMVFVAPQTVLAAFKSLFSYIPGIGFVQKDETTLYLEKPVIIEQDGYTLSLDQVVADKNKVSIAYHMISPTANFNHCAYNENYLLWPDGKSNNPIGGGLGSETDGSIKAQIDYFPLPEGETQASLKVSADLSESGCAAPSEWIVPFTLGTDVPDAEILPVVVSDPTQSDTASSKPNTSNTDAKIQMIVDQYVELTDGYLLTGHIENQEQSWRQISTVAEDMSALDANGNSVPLKQADVNLKDNEFAVIVATKDFAAPLSIQVHQISVLAYEEKGPSFSFDAGNDPKVDQSWKIDKPIEFAGKNVQVEEVKSINKIDPDGKPTEALGYAIRMSSPERIDANFDCHNKDRKLQGWGEAMPLTGDEYLFTNFYDQGLPKGEVTCTLTSELFKVTGDWLFDWQPSPTAR